MHVGGGEAGRRLVVRGSVLMAAILVAACGTDVQELLEAEAEMTWQASEAIARAEQYDPALATPVEDAEAEKVVACQQITDALQRRIRGEDEEESDFGDDIVSGLEEFVAWVLPVGPVEDCAEAQEQYRQSINDLERRLQDLASSDPPPA